MREIKESDTRQLWNGMTRKSRVDIFHDDGKGSAED